MASDHAAELEGCRAQNQVWSRASGVGVSAARYEGFVFMVL